jgi:hypothetical protein
VSQALERKVEVFLRGKNGDSFLHPLELGDGSAFRETQTIIRERDFPITFQVMQLASALRDHLNLTKSTGTIQIDLNQGGICSVRFREEKKVKHSP